jgi:hypothetical protein
MIRRWGAHLVVIMALFVALDAAVCPVLCLRADAPSHQSKNPTQGSSSASCGACSIGIVPLDAYVAAAPDLLTAPPIRHSADRALLAHVADIDHPPRLL